MLASLPLELVVLAEHRCVCVCVCVCVCDVCMYTMLFYFSTNILVDNTQLLTIVDDEDQLYIGGNFHYLDEIIKSVSILVSCRLPVDKLLRERERERVCQKKNLGSSLESKLALSKAQQVSLGCGRGLLQTRVRAWVDLLN